MSPSVTLQTMFLLEEVTKDEELSAALFNKYFQFLENYASPRMSDQLKRRVGPDDIAISVCQSFLAKAEAGAVRFDSSQDVWKYLAFKVRQRIARRVEHHSAEKRAMGREVNSASIANVVDLERATSANDPFAEAAFRDEMIFVLNAVVPRFTEIISESATACSISEIATSLGVDADHVRRALVLRYRNSMTEIALAECIERSCPSVRRIAAKLEAEVRHVLESSV